MTSAVEQAATTLIFWLEETMINSIFMLLIPFKYFAHILGGYSFKNKNTFKTNALRPLSRDGWLEETPEQPLLLAYLFYCLFVSSLSLFDLHHDNRQFLSLLLPCLHFPRLLHIIMYHYDMTLSCSMTKCTVIIFCSFHGTAKRANKKCATQYCAFYCFYCK